MARHVQPLRRTYTMPLTTSRRSTVRGLPPVLADGSRGSQNIPLFVGQVAGVWFAFHTSILIHVQDFSHTL